MASASLAFYAVDPAVRDAIVGAQQQVRDAYAAVTANEDFQKAVESDTAGVPNTVTRLRLWGEALGRTGNAVGTSPKPEQQDCFLKVSLSQRYLAMDAQISTLRRHLVPKRLSPTGNYARSDRVSVHSLGFRILCVAEIENYLEDRCAEIAKTALDSWRSRAHFSPSLQSLTVFTVVKYDGLPHYMTPQTERPKGLG